MAVFWTVLEDSNIWRRGGGLSGMGRLKGSADVQMAVATLASLRLLVRIGGGAGGGDGLEAGGKWKVNVGWEVVRGVARSVGVEVEDYLVD